MRKMGWKKVWPLVISSPDLLWLPDRTRVTESQIRSLLGFCSKQHGFLNIASWLPFCARSCCRLPYFTAQMLMVKDMPACVACLAFSLQTLLIPCHVAHEQWLSQELRDASLISMSSGACFGIIIFIIFLAFGIWNVFVESSFSSQKCQSVCFVSAYNSPRPHQSFWWHCRLSLP